MGQQNNQMEHLRGQELHDRVSRGESLTPQEQAELDAWYSEQDAIESHILQSEHAPPQAPALQSQIDAGLEQLITIAKRIQAIAAENERLRQEIVILRERLPQMVAR